MNFNKIILAGNLTRDPELRSVGSDNSVANFTIAVSRKTKDKEDTAFIDCEAWGRTAQGVADYFAKGRPILIEGRLKMDSWSDKDSGQKRTKLMVVAERFEFVDSGGKGRAAPVRNGTPPAEDEDIPF